MIADQKTLVHRVLSQNGYPIPMHKEYVLNDLQDIANWIRTEKGRFVVKPTGSSGGSGVTTGVNSAKRLRSASITAAEVFYKQEILIEKEFSGDSYRLLYLNGKLIDAIKRMRPSVIGDGKHTIRQLSHDENMQRSGSGPRALGNLTIDLDCKFYLQDNGISLDTVPKSGELVRVKNVANQNSPRDNFTVRDRVHPYYYELGKNVSSIFGFKLIGVDLMAPNLDAPLDENGGVINEINIPPGLHYHALIANSEDRADIGPQILDYIFTGYSKF